LASNPHRLLAAGQQQPREGIVDHHRYGPPPYALSSLMLTCCTR
jgi:hypothetical protein